MRQFYKACVLRGRRLDITGFCGLRADNIEDAEKQLESELTKNPSRRFYFDAWNESDRPIVVSAGPDQAPYLVEFVGR